MSYRLDPTTGRFVLTSESATRPTRMDSSSFGIRTVSQSSSPAIRSQIVRVNSDARIQTLNPVSTPTNPNQKIYIPSRMVQPELAKADPRNDLSNTRLDARLDGAKLMNQDSTLSNGTRRIVLTNKRRAFDQETIQKASGTSPIIQRDIPTVIRQPVSNTIESRVYIKEGNTINKTNSIKQPVPPAVSQFNTGASMSMNDYLQNKIKELEHKLKDQLDSNNLLKNDSELLKNEVMTLRNENNQMQVELGSLRDLEKQYVRLRQDADKMFDENTALKNQLSHLHMDIEHSNVLKKQSAAILALQQENSNLKSEISALLNIQQENSTMSTEISALRDLQNMNTQLRNQLLNMQKIQNDNSSLKSQLSTVNTQLTLANNQLNMLRVKAGASESEIQHFMESLNNQLQKSKQDLAVYESLKRNIEVKIGEKNLAADEFAQKVYLMLSDNVGMAEDLQIKESQLEQFRLKMEQNKQAIEQLTNFRKGYEENLRIMTTSHETERQKMLDLARQLEEHKIMLKKTKEDLAKAEKMNTDQIQDDKTMRLLKNKDVELTKVQMQLKNSLNKIQRLEHQLQQTKEQSELKNKTDKTQILQKYETKLALMTKDLNAALEAKGALEVSLREKTDELGLARQDIQLLKQQLAKTIQDFQAISSDMGQLSALYASKQNQLNVALNNLKKTDFDQSEKVTQLQLKLESTEMLLENWKSQWKEDETMMRMQIESLRNNWHFRLQKELRSFDQALKQQIEQLTTLKNNLSTKEEKITQLRDNVFSLNGTVTALKAELEIEKLKSISDRKTQAVNFEVQIQGLKNELLVAQKLSDSLNQKLKLMTEDCKKKDEFVHKYILGKKLTADDKYNAELFLKQYELFAPKQLLRDKLEEQLKIISHLQEMNRALVQEIARIKV